MEQLSGLDSFFISAEMHGLPMHISSLSIYDPSTAPNGKVEFSDILQIFEDKIQHKVPILKKRLATVPFNLDAPYWEDDPNFDLVYNIHHIAVPPPGNWEKLCSLVANLHAQPLNRKRPLWEAYVIEGLSDIEGVPKNAFALMLKVHHSIMDGRTGLAIYSNLHSISPEPVVETTLPDITPITEKEPEESLSSTTMLTNALQHNWQKTGSFVKMSGKALSLFTKVKLGVRTKELKELHKPVTRFNGAITPRRVVDRVRFKMEDVSEIKAAVDKATLNDVALTIIAGALRKYLTHCDELPEDSLVAGVPIDVRTPEDEHISGNMVNIMNVALRTDIDGPLERLRAVHKESLAGKAFAKTLGKDIVTEVLDSLYTGVLSWGVHNAVESGIMQQFPPTNNTIITNVPGYPCPIYMSGAKLIESFGMGPLIPNTGLFHTVATTYDFMTVGVTACRQMMPDPAFYIYCLESSYQELYEAAVEPKEEENGFNGVTPIKSKSKKKQSKEETV